MVLSRKVGDPDARILSVRGKDIDDKNLEFTVSEEGGNWFCEGTPLEVKDTRQRESIYSYLEEHGKMSSSEIEQAARDGLIDVAINSVQVILRKMLFAKTGKQLEQEHARGNYNIKGTQQKQIDAGIAEKLKRDKGML